VRVGLPREMRFDRRSDFHQILKGGVKVDSEGFSIYYKSCVSEFKIGFILPKEFGKAVVRNRVRRALQDEFVKLVKGADYGIWVIVRFYARKEKVNLTRKRVNNICNQFKNTMEAILDSKLGNSNSKKDMFSIISSIFILPLRAYQIFISPLLPPSCRFTPSCSEYAIGALKKYGIFYGSIKAMWRLLRCNPLSEGGVDLP